MGVMLKVLVKIKYDLLVNMVMVIVIIFVGDVKFKFICVDIIFVLGEGVSLCGVVFGVEKFGVFMIDYDMYMQVGFVFGSLCFILVLFFFFYVYW